jgi:hypothetical protein
VNIPLGEIENVKRYERRLFLDKYEFIRIKADGQYYHFYIDKGMSNELEKKLSKRKFIKNDKLVQSSREISLGEKLDI